MLSKRPLLFVLSLFSLATVSCADDGGGAEAGELPEVDCAAAPVPKFSEMSAVWAKCTSCHSSTLTGPARSGAPVGYDYDVYASAKAEATEAAAEVFAGTMPIGTTMTDAEKDQLYRRAQCGTPE